MLKKALIISAALLLLGAPAMAQKLAVARACAANISTLCKDVQPGGGRMRACIKSHFGELSGTCQAFVMKGAATGKACIADVKKLCAGVKPGGGRIETCMREHVAGISDGCKDALMRAIAGKN
jgi:hypothetical protein